MAPLLLALLLAALPAAADDRGDGAQRFDGAHARIDAAFAALTSSARQFRPAGNDVRGMAPAPPTTTGQPRGPVVRAVPQLDLGQTASPADVPAWVALLRRARGLDGPHVEPLTILSRASWNPTKPRRAPTTTQPVRVTIHHTASPSGDAADKTAALGVVRAVQADHRARGYDDIGYNFLVGPGGEVIEARGMGVLGAHAGAANEGNMGISLIGNFETEKPAPAQERAAIRLAGYLAYAYGMDPEKAGVLSGHGELMTTACPGRNVALLLPTWRKLVAAQERELEAVAQNAARAKFTPALLVRAQ